MFEDAQTSCFDLNSQGSYKETHKHLVGKQDFILCFLHHRVQLLYYCQFLKCHHLHYLLQQRHSTSSGRKSDDLIMTSERREGRQKKHTQTHTHLVYGDRWGDRWDGDWEASACRGPQQTAGPTQVIGQFSWFVTAGVFLFLGAVLGVSAFKASNQLSGFVWFWFQNYTVTTLMDHIHTATIFLWHHA